MNSIIPIKISLSEIVLTVDEISTDDITLCVIFNHVSNLFKPPFSNLPVQLVNFPMISTMHFKLLHNNKVFSEASSSIDTLQTKKAIEISIDIKPPEDLGSPEKSRPSEANSAAFLGSFKVLIEKEDPELKNCQLCPIFENYTTVSERALEIILETNKDICQKYVGRINELGIDVNELEEGEMTLQRAKNIRCLLVGVNEKLKVLDLFKERCGNLEIQVVEEQKSRQNMQNAFKKTCQEFANSKSKLDKMVFQLEKQCGKLEKRNLELEYVEKAYRDYKSSKDLEIESLSAKLSQLTHISSPSNKSEEIISSLNSTSSFKEVTREMQKSEFLKVTDGYNKLLSQYKQDLLDLGHENETLSATLEKTNKSNKDLTNENETLLNENRYLKSKLAEYETRMMYVKELELQIKKLEDCDTKSKSNYKSMQEQLEKLSQRYHEGSRGLYADKLQLIETNKKISEENKTLKQEIIDLRSQTLQSAAGTTSESLTSPYSVYNSLSAQNSKLLQDCKALCELSNRFEKDFVHEFNGMLKGMIESSERHLMLQRLQSKLLLFLRDKDAENQILRELVVSLQKDRPVYIPVRNDFIDNTLANYLNSRVTPSEVPFVRLDNGVYLFGTRRVVLRIENIGIVIRVGGGFIKIDDFITNNTTSEITRQKIKSKCETPRNMASPLPEEIDRVGSPKFIYTKRNSISSGIPMPKTVEAIQKKGSGNLNVPKDLPKDPKKDPTKAPPARRGTIY